MANCTEVVVDSCGCCPERKGGTRGNKGTAAQPAKKAYRSRIGKSLFILAASALGPRRDLHCQLGVIGVGDGKRDKHRTPSQQEEYARATSDDGRSPQDKL